MKVEQFLIVLATANTVFCKIKYQDDVLEFIAKAGYKGEAYEVETEDGYLLKVHRILPNLMTASKPPVFLMHGIFATSADFVVTGPKIALGYLLADRGYEVWMGNARGGKHSEKHRKLSVTSKNFWRFSWHEIGFFDIPAMINFMLKHTKASRAFYVGHSQGTTSGMVMLSTRPEYNQKLIQVHLMAPAVFLSHSPHPLARVLESEINSGLLGTFSFLEFSRYWDVANEFSKLVCTEGPSGALSLCKSLIFTIVGPNRNGSEIDEVS